MFINFNHHDDATGSHITVRRDDGRNTRIFVPAGLKASATFAQPVTALAASASIIAMAAPKLVNDLSPSGWASTAPKQLAPLSHKFVDLQRAALARGAELKALWNEFTKSAMPLAHGAELRSYLRSMRPAEAFKYALDHYEAALAVVECPMLSGLPADLLERIQQTVIERDLARRYAPPKQPDHSDPLATGHDLEAGRSLAAEALRSHQRSIDEVDDIRAVLKSTVEFTALTADVSGTDAYQMLVAA